MLSILSPRIISKKSMRRRITSLMKIFPPLKLLSRLTLPAKRLERQLKNQQGSMSSLPTQQQKSTQMWDLLQEMDLTSMLDLKEKMIADLNHLPLNFLSKKLSLSLSLKKLTTLPSSNTTTRDLLRSTKDGQASKFLLWSSYFGKRKKALWRLRRRNKTDSDL